jgi:PIN domain nuclease of toxin-antitoxin system
MIADDERLTPQSRKHMAEADTLLFSVVSFWEIAIKQSIERIDFQLGKNWHDQLKEELRVNGIRQLDLDATHCAGVEHLPWHHRDPFDRLLIAQAEHEGLTLLSCDKRLSKYDVPIVW